MKTTCFFYVNTILAPFFFEIINKQHKKNADARRIIDPDLNNSIILSIIEYWPPFNYWIVDEAGIFADTCSKRAEGTTLEIRRRVHSLDLSRGNKSSHSSSSITDAKKKWRERKKPKGKKKAQYPAYSPLVATDPVLGKTSEILIYFFGDGFSILFTGRK